MMQDRLPGGRLSLRIFSSSSSSLQETLRTFSGVKRVLGALGLYRAAFKTIEPMTPLKPLKKDKVETPILALGRETALGDKLAEMVQAVAQNVRGQTFSKCGHFITEERPEELFRLFTVFTGKVSNG
jgi:hypothetical protein